MTDLVMPTGVTGLGNLSQPPRSPFTPHPTPLISSWDHSQEPQDFLSVFGLQQRSSTRGNAVSSPPTPQGHLTVFGYIYLCHRSGCSGI